MDHTTSVDQGDRRDVRQDAAYRKISKRLLPLLLICYVFAALDRVNIGFAKLQMSEDIGISEATYGLGAGIFFLGYVLFEVPSNLILARIGTRKTLVRIMLLWGLTSSAMLFVHDTTSFLVLRFLLGVFEAGFAPGVILYLSFWYPPARLAAPTALFMLAGPISSMIGGPVSAWIMTALDGAWGLAGWHWMFLLEGIPSVLLALVVWRVLANSPAQASWLGAEEKARVARDIAAGHNPHGKQQFREVLRDPRVYGLSLSYFFLIGGMYAVIFWLPTILSDSGVESTMTIGLYSALPYAAAIIAMIVLSRRSDRLGERRLHSAVPAITAGVFMAVAAFTTDQLALAMTAIAVSTACSWGSYAVFWSMPSAYLSGTAAAGGIALINSIGLLGGFISPALLGYLKESTGSNHTGLLVLVGMLLAGGIGIAANRLPARDR
ncbi:MFS transporter (plasmid) [Streptomyces sp. NBC_01005]|uniref:MFS transporter n=1 Tax=unclassified Streptomyces TaxID=2593676 RepID=UPI002E33CA83|nr:MFS transporter [Streptomyces sp. NBC_01362]WSW11326.1 MFS transporter [Streptomyces sp. NBC_01005]WTD00836.1 MFS transporter [Streptomyces sp. NBC_01650]